MILILNLMVLVFKVDDRMKDELCMIQKRLKLQGMKGNYTTRENMHLTLAFIGEYSDPDLISEVMDSVEIDPMKLYETT